MIGFHTRLPLGQRIATRCAALARRPDHLPVVLERGNAQTPWMDRERFLAHNSITAGELMAVVRRRMQILPTQALFFSTTDGVLIVPHQLLSELYARYRDEEDGFLYLQYSLESTFG